MTHDAARMRIDWEKGERRDLSGLFNAALATCSAGTGVVLARDCLCNDVCTYLSNKCRCARFLLTKAHSVETSTHESVLYLLWDMHNCHPWLYMVPFWS